MMKLFIMLIAFSFSFSLFARVGETKEECEKRYGKPVEESEVLCTYKKDGISIDVVFDEKTKKATTVYYRSLNKKQKEIVISNHDKNCISANNQEVEIVQKALELKKEMMNYVIIKKDSTGKIMFIYCAGDNNGLLTVSTIEELKNRIEAKRKRDEELKKKEEDKVKGL